MFDVCALAGNPFCCRKHDIPPGVFISRMKRKVYVQKFLAKNDIQAYVQKNSTPEEICSSDGAEYIFFSRLEILRVYKRKLIPSRSDDFSLKIFRLLKNSQPRRHSFEKQRRFCLQNPLSSIPPFKLLTESNSSLSRQRKRESGMINLNAPPWLLIIFRVFSSSSRCGPTKIHIWARGSSSRPDMQPVQWVGGQRELLTSRLRHSASQGQSRKAAFARIFLLFCVCVAGLFSRIVLSSGSALSPWALQTDPFFIKRRVAEHTGCHGDLEEEDIAPCLRNLPLEKLLQTRPGPPR